MSEDQEPERPIVTVFHGTFDEFVAAFTRAAEKGTSFRMFWRPPDIERPGLAGVDDALAEHALDKRKRHKDVQRRKGVGLTIQQRIVIAALTVLMLSLPFVWRPGDPSRLLFMIFAVSYLIPTYIAVFRKHPETKSILRYNVFLGWNVLIWIGAVIWALEPDDQLTEEEIIRRSASSSTGLASATPSTRAGRREGRDDSEDDHVRYTP